jgi:hypothetical protein
VTKADWFQPTGFLSLNTGTMQRSRFVISRKNNAKIYSDCDYLSTQVMGRIICWDNENEDPTVDNYKMSNISHFTDQNNQKVDWTYLWHMEEDNEGLVWVVTHRACSSLIPRPDLRIIRGPSVPM